MPHPAQTPVQQLWFTAPRAVEVRTGDPLTPAAGELLVATRCSAVSTGTELLLYRGEMPRDMALDATLEGFEDDVHYPVQYGYACVGEVVATGADVDSAWMGRQVFSFQPHASAFTARPDQVEIVPEAVPPEAAVFLANMETAINLLHDGRPLAGERVAVIGQGVVGLLLTAVLGTCPLAELIALDPLAPRRQRASAFGATHAADPTDETALRTLVRELESHGSATGADLIYEVSGAPGALETALALSGYTSRIVVGSWYGNKPVSVPLGGEAHRNRIHLQTSQVSTVDPSLEGRWNKARRYALVWDMIRRLQPETLVSHTLPIAEAPALYERLDSGDSSLLQVLFHYPD